MPGSPGYSDVDASTYVARDVPSGVVNTWDTGHYPLDMVGEHKNTDSKTPSCDITKSPRDVGHEPGNTDVIAVVECFKPNFYTFSTKKMSVEATNADEEDTLTKVMIMEKSGPIGW